MEDATSSWSGFFTPTQDAVLSGLVDAFAAGTIASTAMVYGPAGGSTGKVKYTQNVIVTGYEVSGSVGDLVTATVSMQRTGPSTRSVF
jgi:nitric oxide synthase oxygenase domain/subunit